MQIPHWAICITQDFLGIGLENPVINFPRAISVRVNEVPVQCFVSVEGSNPKMELFFWFKS
jgi:hypothetical protein